LKSEGFFSLSRNSGKMLSRQMGNFESVCVAGIGEMQRCWVLLVACVCGSTLLDSLPGVAYHGTRSRVGGNVISNITSWYSLEYCSGMFVVTMLILSLTVARNSTTAKT
jgi:hypothetical protein